MEGINTPVLLITFNRPRNTKRVLERIVESHPKELFIFQDGPRVGNTEDRDKCVEVRHIIEQTVQGHSIILHTFFSEHNLGCGLGPATGITWFFNNVEQGMIFEDDCLPSPTIFCFYEELLDRYKEDNRISLITGTNALSKWCSFKKDYVFSITGGMTMGCWASWRRAWQLFDYDIKSWGVQENRKQFRKRVGAQIYRVWEPILNQYYKEPPKDAWDYQWAYARLINDTYSVVSTLNQMSNIGFGVDSTHTPDANDRRSKLPLFQVNLPVRFEPFKCDKLFDWVIYQRFSRKSRKPLLTKLILRIIDFVFRR